MIPFPNLLAGIIIGVVNTDWFARIIIPFIWGIISCIYVSIFESKRKVAFIAQKEMNGDQGKLGMNHIVAFYIVEYFTASTTALFFSIISGFIKDLF